MIAKANVMSATPDTRKPDAKNANTLREQGACGTTNAFRSTIVTPSRGQVKGFIVRLALAGLMPIALADWLIQRGGLKND